MKIIDAHIHLYPEPILDKEYNVSREPVNELLRILSEKLEREKIIQGLVYVLDENWLLTEFSIPKNLLVSTVVGVNRETLRPNLERARQKGIKILKILPYDQKITRKDYGDIIEIAEFAEKEKMVLTICSTYGSKLLYETNGIELAAYIKKKVDVPIILAHAGGPKIFEAMSIALEYNNVFLDLSFSLRYWWGSSVIEDYAFAIKKLEGKRVFYGSDYPYVNFKDSLKYFLKFIDKYGFSDKYKNDLLCLNFENFKREYLS